MAQAPLIPLSEEQRAVWRGEVARAIEADRPHRIWWEANLKAYAPQPTEDPEVYGSRLNVNRDFTLVERKKADLFYQRPDVSCTPSPLFAGQEHLLVTHEQILDEKLGMDGVDAKRLAHQVIFDVECPVGTGWSYMGYEATTIPVETQQPDPADPTGLAMITEMVDVPVYERVFWQHVPPTQRLLPASCRSTNWDDAPWLGMRFEMPLRVAKRRWTLPESFTGGHGEAAQHFEYGAAPALTEDVATGSLLYYKSHLYRDDIQHPQHLTKLVLLDGLDAPVEHRDAPEQSFDPQGRLTPDSLVGFPFHPLTVRTLPDSAHVPSDCTVSRPLVNELNRFREQMVEQRDGNTLRWMYDAGVLPKESVEKIVRSPIGGLIGLPSEAFAGEGAIREMPHGTYPRENFQFNDYLDNDLARTHALDSNQSGVQGAESKTATESQIMQANVNARLDFERGCVLDWYVRGVTKFSSLLQRFLPLEQAATIVGLPAAQEWDTWRKTIPASLAFQAQPDSALRTDVAFERKTYMDLYSFLANEPQVQRLELVKTILRKFHLPVEKLISQEPPQKQPEAAKPSFSFTGDDFNPLNPQFSIIMEILRQTGVVVSPQAVQEAQAASQNTLVLQQVSAAQDTGLGATAQTQHGGMVAQAESLSKHQTDQTGGMQGTGQAAPMGPGGQG